MVTRRDNDGASGWLPSGADCRYAVVLAVLVLCGSTLIGELLDDARPPDAWGFALALISSAALAWRRRAPLAALAVTVVAVGVYTLLGNPYGPIHLCMVLAMFEVALRRPAATSGLACGAAAAGGVAFALPRLMVDFRQPALIVIAWTGWFVVPWLLGRLAQVRQAASDRMRHALMAKAALEERMRIAREVHDVAGHGFAVVAMQAGAAQVALDARPDQTKAALEAIRLTSTQALAELRSALDTIHARDTDCPAATGLRGLPALMSRVRAGGMLVEQEVNLSAGELPEDIDAAVYRVVQESLTNVLRHAGPTSAKVRVCREADEIVVEVADRGRGAVQRAKPPGRGLTGMRARVEDAGGSFLAGPRVGGGFEVRARFPCRV
ncbi:sensor histidine kinase [Allokutzneria multivorans]|uniref:histidine kinase n=1 Tax=Allokutzneria multivorans TaxID=1142134 RepID=A0ABP7S7W9_9PSEU